MDSFLILYVVSRYSVSLGGSLWKTTLDIDDLPLLYLQVSRCRVNAARSVSPPLTHEQQSRLAVSGLAVREFARVILRRELLRRLLRMLKVL